MSNPNIDPDIPTKQCTQKREEKERKNILMSSVCFIGSMWFAELRTAEYSYSNRHVHTYTPILFISLICVLRAR